MTVPMILADPDNYGNRPGDGPLRRGGQEYSGLPMKDSDLPSTPSPLAKKQQRALKLVRDLAEGAEKVRDGLTSYLPQAPGEDPINYNIRLERSVFHEFYGDTVEGLTGMVFRKDPVVGDDVPPAIVEHWENIDNAGTHGAVFARELLQDAIVAGHAGILVEFPKTGGAQTAADETTVPAPIRPYWVPIKKENILSWRTTVENGVLVLTQLVLKECTYVPDGTFGEKERTQYRVLYRESGIVGFELLEITDKKVVVRVDQGLYLNQSEIPFVEVKTSGRKSLLESRPPLLGLAYLNVAHYQQWSDQATSLHKTCCPVFVRIGFELMDDVGGKIVLGPNAALDLPKEGDAKYVSHDGAALASVKAALDDLVAQIATLGMSMLSSQKRTAETATAKRIDKAATDSALAVTARALQDGLERALTFHAKYLRIDSGGSITVNRDFENLTLDPQQIAALSQLVVQGQLTIETLWKMLASGNVLPEDFDPEQEAADLAANAELTRVNALADAQSQAALANPDVQIVNPDGSVKATMTRRPRLMSQAG